MVATVPHPGVNAQLKKKREREREREKERERERERKRERERETEIEKREIEKEREGERREKRERERKREKERERKREREGKREREREKRKNERERREREREKRVSEKNERKKERKRKRERERKRDRPVWSFHLCLESGCAPMECHGDRLPGRFLSTGANDTMSAMMKPAKELHEIGVGQPSAACQVMVCPSRRTLVTMRTVTLTTSSRDKLRRAMLSCSLSSSRWLVTW